MCVGGRGRGPGGGLKGFVSGVGKGWGGGVGLVTRGLNGRASASHLGSGSRSMRLFATMGLTEESEACQMSSYIVGRGVPEVEGSS